MKIVHLVHQYPPEAIGGTELYTQTVAAWQARAGHAVTVVYPSQDVDATPHTAEDGVVIRPIPIGPRSRTAVFLATWRHPTLLAALAQTLDTIQPDLVHIQHLMGVPAQVVDLLRERGVPYVITLHDYWFPCANAQLITNTDQTICDGPDAQRHNCGACALARGGLPHPRVAAAFIAPLLRSRQRRLAQVLQRAAAIIAPTRFVRDVYRRTMPSTPDITVIPHGIDVPGSMPQRSVAVGARRDMHVAYIGGLSWQKGVHCLIDAFNGLPPTMRLSIVGDRAQFPEYVADLESRARHPGIAFIGRMPHHAIWAFLQDIDLVAVPTLWYETASLIVQEAFAAGVPVIASRIGVLPERVQDGVDGVLVAPGDVAAWRDALGRFANDPARLATLQVGIQPVVTIEAHIAAVERCYQAALSRPARAR